jgi:hypothetical protein
MSMAALGLFSSRFLRFGPEIEMGWGLDSTEAWVADDATIGGVRWEEQGDGCLPAPVMKKRVCGGGLMLCALLDGGEAFLFSVYF